MDNEMWQAIIHNDSPTDYRLVFGRRKEGLLEDKEIDGGLQHGRK